MKFAHVRLQGEKSLRIEQLAKQSVASDQPRKVISPRDRGLGALTWVRVVRSGTVSGRGEAHATEQARLDGALDLQAKQDSVATQAAVERIGKT
jgi:hypothetical protein